MSRSCLSAWVGLILSSGNQAKQLLMKWMACLGRMKILTRMVMKIEKVSIKMKDGRLRQRQEKEDKSKDKDDHLEALPLNIELSSLQPGGPRSLGIN